MRDLWPLFGNDLAAAQQSILEAQKREPNNLHLLHLAISCGLHDTIQPIAESDALSIGDRATLNYRLQLHQGNEHSAFRNIIHDKVAAYTSKAIEQSLKNCHALDIKMLGGIGDHLEALSILKGWCMANGMSINLHIQEDRIRQLKRLMQQLNWVANLIPYGNQEVQTIYNSVRRIIYESDPNHRNQALTNQNAETDKDIICCWRAAGTRQERFSIHSRSVPFQTVYHFYVALLNKKTNYQITDITNWKSSEKNKLLQLGIYLHNPAKGDAIDLLELAKSHRQIISIDTALAHLCAVNNIHSNLLLSLFPDERWNYLLKKSSCYANNLNIYRQTQFGDWDPIVRQLAKEVIQKLSLSDSISKHIA